MHRDTNDYYELLGVTRDAGPQEIKRAFRERARALHPDVSEEEGAQERFAEIARAYSVLSRPAARVLYDRYGYRGVGNGGFAHAAAAGGTRANGARAPSRSAELAELRIAPIEAARGGSRHARIVTVGPCRECGGSGAARGAVTVECAACGGEGRLRTTSSLGNGRLLQIETCLACAGRGRVPTSACHLCHGSGEAPVVQAVAVRIPPGAEDGSVIRAAQKLATPSPRDVYVRLRIVPIPDSRPVRWAAIVALPIAFALFAILLFRPDALLDQF